MDNLLDESKEDADKLVEVMREDDADEANSLEIINLLSKDNVNMYVDGIPLILFYFKTMRYLDVGVLEAFVSQGCDLNVQDRSDKTPLHWLVGLKLTTTLSCRGLTMEQVVPLVELFILNDANPCLVDNDGNNVLMAAINSEFLDWYKVVKPLIVNPKNTRQLLTETNKLGFNFGSLCMESDCLESVLIELGSIPQDVIMMIDDNGNNILHKLFLQVPEYRSSIWNKRSENPATKSPNYFDHGLLFTRYLDYLVKSGANVSQKNNDGLVPLQMGMLHLNKRVTCTMELRLLIPSNEILFEHVPWSSSIVGLILNSWPYNSIPFVVNLVKSELNCSYEQVLPTALRFKFYKIELFRALVDGGAVATMDDIKQVLQRIDYLNLEFDSNEKDNELSDDKEVLCLLLERGLPDDRVITLNDAIPGLVTYLLRFTRDAKRSFDNVLLELLQKGLVLNIRDIRMALYTAQCPNSCRYFIEHASPELIVELNAECPSVFEQIIASTETDCDLFNLFVRHGVPVTVDSVLKVFNCYRKTRHINKLVKVTSDEVKHRLKDALPNAISQLAQSVTIENQLDLSECHHLINILERLVNHEFKVTIEYLVRLFDASLPFSTLLLLINAVDDKVKVQIATRIPDAIGKLIANESQWNYNVVENCFQLIGQLNSVGLEIKVRDLKYALLVWHDNGPRLPIACLIHHLDVSLKDLLQCEIPDLLVQVLCFWDFLGFEAYNHRHWLMDTIIMLLDKFELDINYSNVTYGSFLHVLIGLSAKFPFRKQELQRVLDKVLTRNGLDLDKASMVLKVREGMLSAFVRIGTVVRPIDLALKLNQFEIVDKLIVAHANCHGLDQADFKCEQGRFLNTAKLLYISGHYVDLNDYQCLKKWIKALPVRSLLELTALSVRKNSSRAELNGIVSVFVFPQIVLNYFKLAHVQLKVEPEDIAMEDIDNESHAFEEEHFGLEVNGIPQQ